MTMQRKMKYLFAGIIVLLLAVTGKTLCAQGTADLKFNEVLVYNDSNYVDEYGQHNPWLELVNSSYSTVNIGGCFLSNDEDNLTKYWIPNDTQETVIPPRGFVLFFADNQPARGIFHLNFTLKDGEALFLSDPSGRIIEKLDIPKGQMPNISYARIHIDDDIWQYHDITTPGSDNDHSRKATAGEKFVMHDPSGVGMVVVAMSVVFFALAILFIVYLLVGRSFTQKKTMKTTAAEGKKKEEQVQLSGEINAAITMALHLYMEEQHDYEDTVLTIKKVARTYSPWSSKIYTLRKYPRQ